MTTSPLRIVLATTNEGKIAELSSSLAAYGVKVLGLADFPHYVEPEETGRTFEENALIKAQAAANATGLISMADDSGLVVEALDGQPGVHSARYADDWQFLPSETRDERNIRKLLHAMSGQTNRACHYACAIAAIRPDGRLLARTGVWHGQILNEPLGNNGFGYDPVFFDPLANKSAAQMDRREKNARSHRGAAIRAILEAWQPFIK